MFNLKRLLKRTYRSLVGKPIRRLGEIKNKAGNKHKCNICGNTFNAFLKYHGGNKNIPEFRKRLQLIDSDRDNFGCPYCPSYDRERHLFLFFDKLDFWKNFTSSKILHFAPEKNLSEKIQSLDPLQYIKADFVPREKDIKKIDATSIPFSNDSFDMIICNHVLEHIPQYLKAIGEIHRVLKPNGIAILQTPYSKILKNNFEDENINTDEQRLFFYGENDHFRIFGEENFFNDLKRAGLKLEVIRNRDLFNEKISFYYGVNFSEDLIKVRKLENNS